MKGIWSRGRKGIMIHDHNDEDTDDEDEDTEDEDDHEGWSER